jgi:hypothetical protein
VNHLLVRFTNGAFGGEPLMLIGGKEHPNEGALATPYQYGECLPSSGHLRPEGVSVYGRCVALLGDMEILGECDDDGELVIEGRLASKKLGAVQ